MYTMFEYDELSPEELDDLTDAYYNETGNVVDVIEGSEDIIGEIKK